jgi:hypothetical protein
MKIKAKVDLTYQPGKQVQFINAGNADEDELIKQCFKRSNTGADELTPIPDSSYDDFFQTILQQRTVRRTGGAKKVYKTRKQVQSKKRKTRRHR